MFTLSPYSEAVHSAVEWFSDLYILEKYRLDDPLTDEELHHALDEAITTLAFTYNRNGDLVREDMTMVLQDYITNSR